MDQPSKIRIGVIGVGSMGSIHADDIHKLDTLELVAVCDTNRDRADQLAQKFDIEGYYSHQALLDKVDLDAVLIATPHYDHPQIGMDAFDRGLHVLIEKPIAVHARAARELIQAYEKAVIGSPQLVFAVMFQQRTYGFWRKIKSMIDGGELGRLVRATWIITDWFRTQSYYDNGGWRATWSGEGGGVLLNQCPHNLDLYQWLVGMPKRVAGFASIGKYHHIEVEDEVTGYFEHENGMVGHFITATAESPGTNRLEIIGENGKLVFEKGSLVFYRNQYSMFQQVQKSPDAFERVAHTVEEIPYNHHGESGHRLVIGNFADAILHHEPLIAPAVEGIHSLTLGNAIMLSSFLGHPIDLPLDEDAYAAKLDELIETSNFKKDLQEAEVADLSSSF